MNNKVFVSGSISINKLPDIVKNSLDKIIENNLIILVGDASGIDTLVQNYCNDKKYFNIIVYSIYPIPRYKVNDNFKSKYIEVSNEIKKERQRQTHKDKAMSDDSNYSLVIWDEKSKGSYANVIRALESKKAVKVYINRENIFIAKEDVTSTNIEFIYRKSNGYTASEVVAYLDKNGIYSFSRITDLNKYLIEKEILKKEDKIYIPVKDFENLFILDMYRGKAKGIKFKNEFFDWFESNKPINTIQESLF